MPLEQRERLADAGQHAERQHVDLEDAQSVQIVLVPFDHGAIGHRRIGDRHDLVEPALGQHEAADMLREVARKAGQLARQLERQAQARRFGIEAALAGELGVDAAVAPAPDAAGQRAHHVLRERQRLADLADRAARAVVDHGRRDAGMLAAVFFVDVLDDLLAPLVLEIDVDVGRLVALGRDEALEQKVEPVGIDLGDAEAEADRGIGRRAAALAEDALAAGKAHDVVHGQEIGRVAQLADQRQLVREQPPDPLRHAVRIAPVRAFAGQLLEPGLRRHAVRHRIDRIVVAQLVEREAAGVRRSPACAQAHPDDPGTAAPSRPRASGGARHWRRAESPPRRSCSARGCRSARPAAAAARARGRARRWSRAAGFRHGRQGRRAHRSAPGRRRETGAGRRGRPWRPPRRLARKAAKPSSGRSGGRTTRIWPSLCASTSSRNSSHWPLVVRRWPIEISCDRRP